MALAPLSSGPAGYVPKEYVGNVAFFFDDAGTGRVIGGLIAYTRSGKVDLSSLGRTTSVRLPSDAISPTQINGVRRVGL